MASENKVILHGFWASPYSRRVELALKLKGIPYDYVEEDISNKSVSLIKYNPIYKKVPVLVHNGKPICESLVILEYIDETWNNTPKLLPQDPYKRSQVRFWATFLQQQVIDNMLTVVKTEGDVQKKALKEATEKLQIFEENMKDFGPSLTFIGGENVGVLDLMFWPIFGDHEVSEQVLGIKALDQEKFPLVCSWISALRDVPVIKESSIPREKLLGLLKFVRQNAIKPSSA